MQATGASLYAADSPSGPNVILILADDLGYSDVGVFGAEGFATPNLDQLAHEGVRVTDFHVAQAVCSASRAAIMTGCYPNRVGIEGAMEPWYDFGVACGDHDGLLSEPSWHRGRDGAVV